MRVKVSEIVSSEQFDKSFCRVSASAERQHRQTGYNVERGHHEITRSMALGCFFVNLRMEAFIVANSNGGFEGFKQNSIMSHDCHISILFILTLNVTLFMVLMNSFIFGLRFCMEDSNPKFPRGADFNTLFFGLTETPSCSRT